MVGLKRLEVIELGYNAFVWTTEIHLEGSDNEELISRFGESRENRVEEVGAARI